MIYLQLIKERNTGHIVLKISIGTFARRPIDLHKLKYMPICLHVHM
jgi:hypothetical protein